MLFLINEELIMKNEEFLSEWDSSFSERSEVFFILHSSLKIIPLSIYSCSYNYSCRSPLLGRPVGDR